MRRWLVVSVLALAVAACDDAQVLQPDLNRSGGVLAGEPVVVMSRNLYLGADIDVLLDPTADLPTVLGTALQQVLYTDFPQRAKALAQEIHDRQPHLVGLQEVTAYAITLGDGTVVPALGFPQDFMQILLAELAALGDTYVEAARSQNVALRFPLGDLVPSPLPLFIAYSDADAILVRDDVSVLASSSGNYVNQQLLSVGGVVFPNLRGWAHVDADVNGKKLRFANTHLEIQLFRPVQEKQAGELIAELADSPWPVVLVGDFNSAANHDAPAPSKTASYGMFRNAGYSDLWLRERGSVGGLTCCQVADLSNTMTDLDQRLDVVFVRWGKAGFGGQSSVEVIGEEVGDIFTHPLGYTLWPSDHAGVAAWIWPAPGRLAAH
jgi:endonuclease/exonuclease/phosphatase family metal-dependent hydrolase